MLKLIIAILALFPLQVLAINCPSNGKLINIGDSEQSVIKVCGKPTSINTINNSVVRSATLTFKLSDRNGNNRVMFNINNGHVTGITVMVVCAKNDADCQPSSTPVKYYQGCAQYIYIGTNVEFLNKNCGEPEDVQVIDGTKDITEELTYEDGMSPNTLVFVNQVLTDWK